VYFPYLAGGYILHVCSFAKTGPSCDNTVVRRASALTREATYSLGQV
jgi:hypothetical protein